MSDVPEKVRLTKAQREFLTACAADEQGCSYGHRASIRLVSLGLITRRPRPISGWWCSITPAGRSALHQEQDDA